MDYYKKDEDRNVLTKKMIDALIEKFHFYASDDSRQDASTNAAQITNLINILVTNIIVTKCVSTIW